MPFVKVWLAMDVSFKLGPYFASRICQVCPGVVVFAKVFDTTITLVFGGLGGIEGTSSTSD